MVTEAKIGRMSTIDSAETQRDGSSKARASDLLSRPDSDFDPSDPPNAVSVIVPAYNGAKYIAETLESILKQTVPAVEVIVVNDGSTDDTSSIVRSFGKAVTLIETPQQGRCKARNLGAQKAVSNWLAFCDQDDIWLPQKLEKQLRLAKELPEINCVITDRTTYVDGVIGSRSHFSYAPRDFWNLEPSSSGFVVRQPIAGRMTTFQPSITSVLFVKRKFFRQFGGFDVHAQCWSSEDTCVHFQCLSVVPFGVIPEVLTLYRRHPEALSADPIKQLRNTVDVWEYIIAEYAEAQPWKDDLQAGLTLLRKEVRECVRHRRRQKIKRILMRLRLWRS
jgi:glycosyltransferase involved in cell wall biosynthesis